MAPAHAVARAKERANTPERNGLAGQSQRKGVWINLIETKFPQACIGGVQTAILLVTR